MAARGDYWEFPAPALLIAWPCLKLTSSAELRMRRIRIRRPTGTDRARAGALAATCTFAVLQLQYYTIVLGRGSTCTIVASPNDSSQEAASDTTDDARGENIIKYACTNAFMIMTDHDVDGPHTIVIRNIMADFRKAKARSCHH